MVVADASNASDYIWYHQWEEPSSRKTNRNGYDTSLLDFMTKTWLKSATETKRNGKGRSSTRPLESKSTEFEVYKMAFIDVHYRLTHNRETQMQQYKHVEHDRNVSDINWSSKVRISDNYEKDHADFIKILSKLNTMRKEPFGTIRGGLTQHWTIIGRFEASLLCTIPGQTEVLRIQKRWNCKDAWAGSHQTSSNWVVIGNCPHPQNWQHYTIFCGLQEAQCMYIAQVIPHSTYGQVHILFGIHHYLRYIRRPQWLLESLEFPRELERKPCSCHFTFYPCSVGLNTPLGTFQLALHVLHLTVQKAVCISASGQRCHSFGDYESTCGIHATHPRVTIRC